MKQVVLICSCGDRCLSMSQIDFRTLAERVHHEFPETELVSCEEAGERLMERLLDPDTRLLMPACQEMKQRKLLAAKFQQADVPMDRRHWLPISLGIETTDSIFEKIRAALTAVRVRT